ncbi:MAG TPA: carbon-nitrogen hydrolase family protein [Chroococcales cyanobacterium]
MKVAVAQMSVGMEKSENLRKIDVLVAQAQRQGANLVAFPEASMVNFGDRSDPLTDVAEPLEGPFVLSLRDLARTYHIGIVAGIFESSVDANKVYNSLVIINDKGELKECYRKIHLYDAFGYRESDRFLAGDGSLGLFEQSGMSLGAMTCYDLRFPELARQLAFQGAEAIILPAAWFAGPLKETHFETLLRARAIENNIYMVSAVQVGPVNCGASMVVDPMGVVQASLSETEGVLVSELSSERVAAVREVSPTFQNRRIDVYARWKQTRWYEEAVAE